jgi:hypothetical protein
MNDYSVFDKNGIPRPPSFAGMTGQGADAMYSVGGRWMKAGQKTSDGYLINSYDPKSYTLGMSYQGVPVPVQMQTSIIPPYTPQFVKESGGMTEADQKRMDMMNNSIGMANSYLSDPTLDLPKEYSFDAKALENMKNNYFSDKEKQIREDLIDVVSLEQFKDIASSPEAKSGLYYVPYQDNDGNVDFHEFFMENQQRAEQVTRKNADGTVETIKIPYANQ